MNAEAHPQPFVPPAATASAAALWADKYKPASIEQMCYPVCAQKILAWIRGFDPTNPKQLRGALLSGPPGVGKTTTVYMVAKALGKDVIEYNASDFRSKKSLREMVSGVVDNRVFSASGFLRKTESADMNFILLMDEVDGCDLGGVGEVIQMIKTTKIPILCTCNDRWHQKLRTLTNYVEDVRFTRPPCNLVANYICDKILAREGVSLPKQILQDIIKNCGSDIRNVLNNLQMWCLKRNILDQKTLAHAASSSMKNVDSGLFDTAEKFLLQGSSSGAGPQAVGNLLQDYYNADLIDLFVQENYLHFRPDHTEWLGAVSKAATSISEADALQRIMYQEQNWTVSNSYIILSSIAPCAYVRGHYQSFAVGAAANFDRQRPVKFPTWLGANSSASKNERLLTMLVKQGTHPNGGFSGTKRDVGMDYIPLALIELLTKPLAEQEREGIPQVMAVMNAYHMLRDDWDFVQDVGKFNKMESAPSVSAARHAYAAKIPTAVKSAFTREFNKTHKFDTLARSTLKHVATGEEAPRDDEEVFKEAEEEENEAKSLLVAPKKTPAAKGPPAAGSGKGKAPAAKKAPQKRPLTFIKD